VARGAQGGFDRIAFIFGQVVPLEVAVFLQMLDDQFDITVSSHFMLESG
jgi:hypothetical protein